MLASTHITPRVTSSVANATTRGSAAARMLPNTRTSAIIAMGNAIASPIVASSLDCFDISC